MQVQWTIPLYSIHFGKYLTPSTPSPHCRRKCYFIDTHTHTHTHARARAFNRPFSETTRLGQYEKGKTNLKQETVSGSGISWAICKSALRSRQTTTPAPNHSVFLQAGCPSCRPTNSVKALKATNAILWGRKYAICALRWNMQKMDSSTTAVLTSVGRIGAATYWITLRILNACWIFPILYNRPAWRCPPSMANQ